MKDNAVVVIKRLPYGEDSPEFEIGQFFSGLDNPRDPRNHCVPILDAFKLEEDRDASYIVMPLLRDFDSPPFYALKEVVEFVYQTLQVRRIS